MVILKITSFFEGHMSRETFRITFLPLSREFYKNEAKMNVTICMQFLLPHFTSNVIKLHFLRREFTRKNILIWVNGI